MAIAVLTDAQRQKMLDRLTLPIRTRDSEGNEVTERDASDIAAALALADAQAAKSVKRRRRIRLMVEKDL